MVRTSAIIIELVGQVVIMPVVAILAFLLTHERIITALSEDGAWLVAVAGYRCYLAVGILDRTCNVHTEALTDDGGPPALGWFA